MYRNLRGVKAVEMWNNLGPKSRENSGASFGMSWHSLLLVTPPPPEIPPPHCRDGSFPAELGGDCTTQW